jgi:predicted nucleic acid-binding protein
MALLIDASVFITLERRGDDPANLDVLAPDDQLGLAAITAAELLIGVERADTAGRRARRAAFVESLLQRVPIVPIDLAVARVLAQIWAQLAAAGTPIGPYDLLVAATALSRGDAVLTENVQEFRRVSNLTVRQPAWPTASGE